MNRIGNDWDQLLREEFESPYYKDLEKQLDQDYACEEVYPPRELVFEALRRTSFSDSRVVILGQDPYHGPGQGHGLAFSVRKGIPLPPSLRNIYKELEEDLGFEPAKDGNLTSWADQGVLLINASFTVKRGQAASHAKLGWQQLSDRILQLLGQDPSPRVFMLWGNHARKKKDLIGPQHLVLEAAHPSPLSAYRGFFGCKHFSLANEFLGAQGRGQINWKLD